MLLTDLVISKFITYNNLILLYKLLIIYLLERVIQREGEIKIFHILVHSQLKSGVSNPIQVSCVGNGVHYLPGTLAGRGLEAELLGPEGADVEWLPHEPGPQCRCLLRIYGITFTVIKANDAGDDANDDAQKASATFMFSKVDHE